LLRLSFRAIGPSLLLLAMPSAARAQSTPGVEAPTARVAVLSAALYNEQANLREDSDSAKAGVATEVLRTRLAGQLGDQLVSFKGLDSLASSPVALELTGGVSCNVKVSCARMVARALGAPWVVLTKVSKTSNLIWLLSAQLIKVATGEIILDDSTELKGAPEEMVRVGVRQFADRVARTVANGGRATNYPDPDFEAQAISNWPIQ
jgi:hypothetical protein